MSGDFIQMAKTSGNMFVPKALTVGTTATITGAVTFSSTVAAGGSITLGAGADLIGSSTSDITINTNKFTVAGATGNTVIAGTLTLTGNVDLDATLTIGADDTGYDVVFYGATSGKKFRWVEASDMCDIDGIMKVHNRPVSTDTYALEVKCDYDQASGTGQGALQVSTRVYPSSDTTTLNAQGGYSQIQFHSADTMTGGGMVGFLAQAQNDSGTLNGSGITVYGLRSSIADGGTWTQVSRVASMHVYSALSQTVSSGTYNLLFIQNAGTTTAADAIAVDGNDKITALMTLTNVDGAAMVANGSVLNDISSTANDGYIKVIVEGETKYIALYDTKS